MKVNWPADKVERQPIPEADGYEACSNGDIRSVPHRGSDGRLVKGRVLRQWRAAGGYLYVSLGRAKKISVHRAVALAFYGHPPSQSHEAAHLDGNVANNVVANIQWKTRKENEADKYLHGTWRRSGLKGERHHRSKLNDAAISEIRSMATGARGERVKIAAAFGVNPSTIGRVLSRAGWAHV